VHQPGGLRDGGRGEDHRVLLSVSGVVEDEIGLPARASTGMHARV